MDGLFDLSGRVALVTGARHGIGRAIGLALARAGARVAVTAREVASLEPLATEFEALGAEHLELALELSDADAIRACVRSAAERWQRLDIVVNNAGRSLRMPAATTSAAEWDDVMASNLRGPFLVAQAAAGEMVEAGGRIINVSSSFARVAVSDRAAYATSKAGLEHLTRVLALEWAPRGITINAVAPGVTPTETRAAVLADEAMIARRVEQIPLGRLGSVEDVVGPVLLLASDAGAFITGTTIVVDGGFGLGAR